MKRILPNFLALAALVAIATMPAASRAATQTDANKYVRTANYFLLSGSALDTAEARTVLPTFDLLILPVEAQAYNRAFFEHARRVNPDIVILAYVVSDSWNNLYWGDPLHQDMLQGIDGGWWLTDGAGNRTSNWPGLSLLNLNSGWTEYLAAYTARNIIGSGLWDGVMYDDVGDGISSVGAVDVNRDGARDDAAAADALWRAGYVRLVSKTRELAGASPIIITNGSSRSELAPFVNGRMFESFPTPWEGNWTQVTRKYLDGEKTVRAPQINIINGNTDNTGRQNDYADMRFALTTTLLGGGYFGYDFGTTRHQDFWTYDEYRANLGAPVGEPIDRLSTSNTTMRASVWQRNFGQGAAIVNSTASAQHIELGGEYEHLRGVQDPSRNNGRVVTSVDIPAKDGVVLLRTIENIVDAAFKNGAFVRIFDGKGTSKRNGFFAYDAQAKGSERVLVIDLDHDGRREKIIAGNSRVDILSSGGGLARSFFPYGETYKSGVNIAVGDLENDGTIEIVTGTERGGGAQIRVFNKDGVLINPGFFAYDSKFRGGVSVAVGDLNGDGTREIIAGAGAGGGPHVRVFNKNGKLLNPGFFAYDPKFRGGVHVAAGDVNGDGIDDIITGAGQGGGPEVRVFDRNGARSASFFAFGSKGRGGVDVSAADLDGDGKDEILGISAEQFSL